MADIEMLLSFIAFLLLIILMYVRWIYIKVQCGMFDPKQPVNQYGENFTDAIQESFVRGQRGISQYD